MANKKITDLPAGVNARADDLIEIVQYPGGTPTSKTVSMEELPIEQAIIPPATANSLDDEFTDAATLPGGGSAAWTWVNQGGSSITCTKGKLVGSLPFVNAQNVRGIEKTLPAAPWEFQTKCTINGPFAASHQILGLFLRDSATSKLKTLGLGFSSTQRIRINDWTNASSHSAQLFTGDTYISAAYFKIADDNTNWIFSISQDGIGWYPVFSQARNTFLTANRIGLMWYFEASAGTTYFTFDYFRRTV